MPAVDPYLDAALPTDVVRVRTADGGTSPWLDPAYLAAHGSEIDVLHLLAGYESLTAAQLDEWTTQVRRCGLPLVLTVAQLRAVDGSKARLHAHLKALLTNAEVVLTLTPGAAGEIGDRYRRTAIVVAHPSLAGPAPGIGRETRLVGLHLDPVALGVADPLALVRGVLSGALSGGGRLRVDVPSTVDPDSIEGLAELAASGALELRRVHLGDPGQIVAHLQELHVSVLPDRVASHSRWVEYCRDAGTRLVVPRGGHHAEQWSDVVPYGNVADAAADAASVSSAVVMALTRPQPPRVDAAWRGAQRDAVRRVHAQVYAQVAGDRLPT